MKIAFPFFTFQVSIFSETRFQMLKTLYELGLTPIITLNNDQGATDRNRSVPVGVVRGSLLMKRGPKNSPENQN